jgi:16S rRNA processing protein RimM
VLAVGERASTSSTSRATSPLTRSEPMDAEGLVAIGRIGPAHGNRGDAFVEPWTDAPDERFAPGVRLRTDPPAADPLLTVESHRFQGDRLIVHFVGVDDRDAIAALRATLLLVPATERPPLPDPDEFYDTDLIGLHAVGADGAALGDVLDVVHLAGAVYLVLRVDGAERMVPFVSTVVPEVDLAGGRVVIAAPDGLFEL